jgi:hypothetical protein
MSNPWGQPWSDRPYAPQIPYWVYFAEKASFAGAFIGAIFYGTLRHMSCLSALTSSSITTPGIVVVLFFQCMGALLNPANCTGGSIKWGLVVHTATMFSFVTVYTATALDILSICYIDGREFPGGGEVLPPGPLGYRFSIYPKPLAIVPNVLFLLNNWLADGLLVSSESTQLLKRLT